MDTKLITDFESAIQMTAEVYFFGGFFAGVAACAFIVARGRERF